MSTAPRLLNSRACASFRFATAPCHTQKIRNKLLGGIAFARWPERVEAKSRGFRQRPWRAGALPDFVSGFFGSHISGDQRFAADRAGHAAAGAHAVVCL